MQGSGRLEQLDKIYGFLCDKRVPTKVKGKALNIVARSAIMFEADTWSGKKYQKE